MGTFNDPRVLPCIHTFCLQCINCIGKTAQKKPGDKIPCPLCRKEFTIPTEGMTGLQKNFFIESLMELKTIPQKGSTSGSCDMCIIMNEGETENISTASKRCLECKENYCDRCSNVHQKQKMSVNHHIVKLGKETEEENLIGRMISVTTCTKHTQKPLDYYCADCKKVVCVLCFADSHKLHDCKNVATVDEEFRQTIGKHSWKISTIADKILSMKKNTEARKADFLKEIVEVEKAIQKRNEDLKLMIDEHTKSLLEELSLIKSNQLKEIENEMEEIDRCSTTLRSFEAYCTKLRLKGSASDIRSSFDELTRTAKALEQDQQELIDRPRQSVEVSFQAADFGEALQMSKSNVLGQIKETVPKFENYAIVAGLNDGKIITRDVIQINMHRPNEILTEKKVPTVMRIETIASVYCNTMYVIGIGAYNDEILKYSKASGWMKCASLVQGRSRHSATFIDEVLYIGGGFVYSDVRVLDSVEAYNAVTNRCTAVGKLLHCVQSSANCVPFKSSLYIFGGCDKNNIPQNHVQVYNTKQNTCAILSKPMPPGCSLMPAVVWETSVILLGCYTCFLFNFETEIWQEREEFKTDVVHFGLVLENERIFVIGGGKRETDKGEDGGVKWKCRDDVRYVPLQNFIEDQPIEWKTHAKLPQPSLIFAYAKLNCFVP